MPGLSVWAVRLSLVYFAAGSALGALLLAGKAVALPPALWALRPAHVEGLLFGFMVQFVMGVGFWMLPRAPARVGERGVAGALGLLNAGVLLVSAGAWMPVLEVAGRVGEAAAFVLFALHVWPRVRAARRA